MKDLLHQLRTEIRKVEDLTAQGRWKDEKLPAGALAYLRGKRAGLILAAAIVKEYDEG